MEMKYCFREGVMAALCFVLSKSFKFYWLLAMVLVVVGVRSILYSLLNNWRENYYFFIFSSLVQFLRKNTVHYNLSKFNTVEKLR